jgi:apolipoprotein D and lipocalin family protein
MKIFALAALLAFTACAPFIPSSRWVGSPMFVVSNFEAAQLKGRWYEVASFPTRFQAGCYATVAEYTARDDGLIGVRNTCRVEGQPGVIRQIEGTATVVGPGQLQVRLDGVPFPAKYWVLGKSRDGRTLIVGTPTRQGGWVLRRDPGVTPEQLYEARGVFERNGYDVAALQRTRQR